MFSTRRFLSAAVLTVAVVGCTGAPPKEIPKLTPAEQAELDKQHAEKNAASGGAGGAAAAPN